MLTNLDLYRGRVGSSRQISRTRQENNKVATFKNALDRSYNSEIVIKDNEKIKSLISGIPTHPQIEKKNFATLLDHSCEVGDEVYWERDSSHWIITSHDSTERAVFQGFIEKALYELKWRDPEFGTIYETRACAKGPEQVTISDGVKHSIFYDDHTDSLHLIVSTKAPGVHLLERYFSLMVEGRKWRIEVADRITKEKLVILELIEEPTNRHEDTEDLVGGQKEHRFKIHSILDYITDIRVGESVEFQPRLYNNENIAKDPRIEITAFGAEMRDNEIHFNEIGQAEIIVTYPDYNQRHKWLVEVSEDAVDTVEMVGPILGNGTVLTMMRAEFELQAGKDTVGEWDYNENFFEPNASVVDGKIMLKAKSKTGSTTIGFDYMDKSGDSKRIEKAVRVIPIFGGGR